MQGAWCMTEVNYSLIYNALGSIWNLQEIVSE